MANLFNSADNYIELLIPSPLFNGLRLDEIEAFLDNNPYEIVEIKSFEELPVDYYQSVFVLSGAVATYEFDRNGKKNFLNFCSSKDNQLVPISISKKTPSISIIAKKPSVILLLKSDAFFNINPAMLIIQNKVQQNLIKMFYNSSDSTLRRLIYNTEPQARNKILKFITDLYKRDQKTVIKLPLTRDELAAYLQMDTSTLMRELKKLKSENILSYDRNGLTILDVSVFA